MSYAIISIGGKQYRVREGQRLLVDRMKHDAGATFTPSILLAGGDGDPRLSPDDVVVTARVVGHVRGPKLRIFKFKPKTGYRRTTGFRSALTQIEIESIGAQRKRSKAKAEKPAEPEAAAVEAPAEEPSAEPEAAAVEAPAEEPSAEPEAAAVEAPAEEPPAEPEAAAEEAPAEEEPPADAEEPTAETETAVVEAPAEDEPPAQPQAAADEAPAEEPKPKPKAARKPRTKKTTEEGS
jgi:ribosomal protein L21